jgi:hypothetical protein
VPFIKLRSSDELKFVPKLSGFLNTMKPLLFNPNSSDCGVPTEYVESLRMGVIMFLKSFAEDEISKIMNQEAGFENKRMQGYDASPLQKLMK